MQWWANFGDTSRPLRGLALVVGVLYQSAVTCIQILNILQTHDNIKHVPHAQGCVWKSVQKSPRSFQQVASNIDVVVCKIIQT